jgi:hypothetical protein
MEMVVGCPVEAGPATAKAGTVKLVAMYCVHPLSMWPAGKYMESTSATWRELSDGWRVAGLLWLGGAPRAATGGQPDVCGCRLARREGSWRLKTGSWRLKTTYT